MFQITGSCDEKKLRKVIVQSRYTLSQYTGLTAEDKEEIIMDVIYRFEADKARFPISVYVRHCKNKIIGFLGKKTAKKRMLQKVVDGKVVYIENVSLSTFTTEDESATLEDIVPDRDNSSLKKVELLADIERKVPELLPLVTRILEGDKITPEERKLLKPLRALYKKEDLR